MNVLSALSFSSPWILAALASLPVIWLLLRATPPTPAQVQFPAFIILRRLASTEEQPDKTPWWLLLLRLMIAALIILGLAGPVLNAAKGDPTNGPLLVVVDDTWPAAKAWRARRDAMALFAAEAETSERQFYLLTTAPSERSPSLSPMSATSFLDRVSAMTPAPFRANRRPLMELLSETSLAVDASQRLEIRWLADGLDDADADAFAQTLAALGELTVYADPGTVSPVLVESAGGDENAQYEIRRLQSGAAQEFSITAMAYDGRELSRQSVPFEADARSVPIALDLPLALRNEIASIRIDGASSAASVFLADARDRRALVGLVDGRDSARAENLLSGVFYIEKALEPFAAFLQGGLEELLQSDVSVIALDDVGRLRSSDAEALTTWIEEGGVVIRFAGPTLADAAQDETPRLLPVPLRGGGRAFGGALSWETPQPLGAFHADGPFADLTPPSDVRIRRQVLADPGGATSRATWASLADGTPLVTGERIGRGALVLIHVTATPAWSDLPVSGVFVDMMRKLIALSVIAPRDIDDEEETRLSPLRLIDGFGAFAPPPATLSGVTIRESALGPSLRRPPGFYGAPDAPLAINAVSQDVRLEPLALPGVTLAPYEATPPTRLAPPLFAVALFLFLLDLFAALHLAGRLTWPVAASIFVAAFAVSSHDAAAQPLDSPIDDKAIDAALETRLAYVRSGDPEVDRLSERGLAALSAQLIRRTAIEPATPTGVNPDTDDLSVYPFLYWPIVAGAAPPSDAALANIENFMRFGGLIVFDTRDDERAVAGFQTPERNALREILSRLDVPPLTPLPADHVLTRSFYLLPDLPGRMRNNPVWVQAAGAANDAVTPVIIGGRDWAGAWASDELGRPLLPLGRGGPRQREMTYRAGINMVMVAYTGNYKSDQVHTPILLRRLGQ